MSWYNQLVPTFVTDSYSKRFTAIVLVVLLITGGAGLYFQQQVSAELEEETRNQMEGMATDQANSIEQWVTENQRTTRMIARADGLETEDHPF